MKDAPLLIDHLDNESLAHFEKVKKILIIAGIPFEEDAALVRGLDYYTNTTFEIVSGSVGSQSALCGGGRYDLLIEQLGGKPTPGVGVAAGMERMLLACENEKAFENPVEKIDLYIVRIDEDLTDKVYELALYFRQHDLSVEIDYMHRSVKAQMREANKLNSSFVIFAGGDEYKTGKLQLKNMADGEQQLFALDEQHNIFKKIAEK
jgi:histidyl-tRNA synthetase